MKSRGKLSRRSFLGRVVGGAVIGGGAIVALTSSARAQINDSDPSDPANRTGLTDADPTDRAGNAPRRGASNRIRGCTDNDRGANSDPGGNGRGNGVTDNDQGTNSDPARCGRR